MLNIAVVEDEISYQNTLREYIGRYKKESHIDIAVTFFQDGEDIAENYPGGFDIIMLDIMMQFMDGMTAAEKIRARDDEVIIIFITNMTEYALKGYRVNAMDYLIKPVSYFALHERLDKALKLLGGRKAQYLSIKNSEGIRKIDIAGLYYVESQGHNLRFVTDEGEFICRMKMQDVDDRLSQHGFFRAGKGYLVNMRRVIGVNGNTCRIHDEQIPISRGRKDAFMEQMLQIMSEDSL